MAVPKKRVGQSDQGHRRSCWKAFIPTVGQCPNCGAPKRAHTLCGVCGYYKGKVVSERLHRHHEH
jgi:large subunit ribosomal protein L32